ncbi:ThiF family adenylyltransferase [Amycolatopsis magusensis]|uniref:ThiF family adenylyltransferase n=1 Tax=Amycolatopsis magusensis TaxID=882444 RepID=UPI0024A7A62F|nr:ThiF family adenylyltransferase [Amycolatopsis magusensis]MDI5975477.1 ThiF family adenylyltransferase [Amycolatopsis magusensis]
MTRSLRDLERWREQFPPLGFADDGERLWGPVRWNKSAGEGHQTTEFTARVVISPGRTFPFAPPKVTILDPGGPLEITFHINADGSLCLWEDDWPADEAPWLDAQTLVDRISGWLRQTATGWPGDNSCDLERYLDQEEDDCRMLLYDATRLVSGQAVQTRGDRNTVVITDRARQTRGIVNGRRRNRNERRLAWVAMIGKVERPLQTWDDVATALGDQATEVRRLITLGVVTVLLLQYNHGDAEAALALRARPDVAGIRITACESADTSSSTRTMRAGLAGPALAGIPVAVVGCGAIGSFTADLLFRSGFRKLTLLDAERLRPGNVVRHLAGAQHVGLPKTDAVRNCLTTVDPDVTAVQSRYERLTDLDTALDLVRQHRVVVDATGSGRASSLLATAAALIDSPAEHTVVSVCVQRDGDVLRVDRTPLRPGENHLPPLALVDQASELRERGCGSPVSPTPPGAVVAAAELALRAVIDEATGGHTLPATLADVRRPQGQPPFDRVGRVASEVPHRLAS